MGPALYPDSLLLRARVQLYLNDEAETSNCGTCPMRRVEEDVTREYSDGVFAERA